MNNRLRIPLASKRGQPLEPFGPINSPHPNSAYTLAVSSSFRNTGTLADLNFGNVVFYSYAPVLASIFLRLCQTMM